VASLGEGGTHEQDTTTPIPFVSDEDAALTQERLERLSAPLDAHAGRIDTTGGRAR